MASKKAGIGFVTAFFIFLAGCASIEDNPRTTELVVKYATLKVIHSDDDVIARAERIAYIANGALALASGQPVLVSELKDYVNQTIEWDTLDPADSLAVMFLIDTVAMELEARVGDGNWLTGEHMVSVAQVFQWVLEAADSQDGA